MGTAAYGTPGYNSARQTAGGQTEDQRKMGGGAGTPAHASTPAYIPNTTWDVTSRNGGWTPTTTPSGGAAPPPTLSGSPPPTAAPPPPGSSLLGGPGPFEDWASRNQHAFDNPGATENLYSQHGDDWKNKSYSEDLYEQGMGQMDPHYNYAQQKATGNINDAMAARGGFNSGAAIQKIGDSAANLYGQQAMQMGGRAVAADNQRTSRYGMGLGMAQANDDAYGTRLGSGAALHRDWQNTEENRLNTGLDRDQEIASDKAHLTQTAFNQGGQEYGENEREAISAQLRANGIDSTGDIVADARKLVELGIKAGG